MKGEGLAPPNFYNRFLPRGVSMRIQNKMQRILCIGDSNTFGYDPRSWFGGCYPAGVRWTDRLRNDSREVINCGRNGMCIPEEREFAVVRSLIRSRRPVDIITVMLGDNDFLTAASAETVTARMRAFLTSLLDASEGERILLIAPPPLNLGDWVRSERTVAETGRLGALYRALAEELGVDFADADSWDVELSYDGVHFTEQGHAAFAAGLENTLNSLQADESS